MTDTEHQTDSDHHSSFQVSKFFLFRINSVFRRDILGIGANRKPTEVVSLVTNVFSPLKGFVWVEV